MLHVLFAAHPNRWKQYKAPLIEAFAAKGLDVDLRLEYPPDIVDYIIYAPNSHIQDFTPYVSCKAVMTLWAGVEGVVHNPTLTQPLTRMVDHGLTQGMCEWVVGHVLRHHLGMDTHILGQTGIWRNERVPPLAHDRSVGILGAGALGGAAGQALAQLGFDVACWSQSEKEMAGIAHFFGAEGLEAVLRRSQILVLLLPFTPKTEAIINAGTLDLLPRGAILLNPGRGGLIDDDALLAALNSGKLAHATLDVFTKEPLPPEHPYWSHPRVTVTPHIASETRPKSASMVIADNIARNEAGESLRHLVDRNRGY